MNRDSDVDFLRDFAVIAKEKALAAKRAKKMAEGTKDGDYALGFLMAYHEIVSTLKQQAEVFGIPLEKLGLDDIDPERDLL